MKGIKCLTFKKIYSTDLNRKLQSIYIRIHFLYNLQKSDVPIGKTCCTCQLEICLWLGEYKKDRPPNTLKLNTFCLVNLALSVVLFRDSYVAVWIFWSCSTKSSSLLLLRTKSRIKAKSIVDRGLYPSFT